MAGDQPFAEPRLNRACVPAILLVDNRREQIQKLFEELKAAGYDVVVASSVREAEESLAQRVFDLALLDVCFSDPTHDRDRSGIKVLARNMLTSAPETPVVFISRPDVIKPEDVLEIFNRIPPSQRPPGGKIRLAEAYADKRRVGNVLEICKDVLESRGLAGPLRITASEQGWNDIDLALEQKVVAGIRGESEIVEPNRQFIQILRRLAYRDFLQLDELHLENVSKGRSRSIVLAMSSRCGNDQDNSVVKIGDKKTILLERDNYAVHVPRFIQAGKYPMMTACVEHRQLAGIAYSQLGSGSGLPVTFADVFWKRSDAEVEQILTKVFHEILMTDQCPQPAIDTLYTAYRDRFRALDEKSRVMQNIASFAKSRHIQRSSNEREWRITINDTTIPAPNPVVTINNDCLFHYRECLVHGDLHGDNVLLPGDDVFLIDFSHTRPNHVFLDYVVMEAMVRNQLLRQLVEGGMAEGGLGPGELCEKWIELEVPLIDDKFKKALSLCDAWGRRDFGRLVRLIQWLRENARLKGFNEPYQNYFAGLGMVATSFLALPDESRFQKYFRSILLTCACLALNRATASNDDRQSLLAVAASSKSKKDATMGKVFTANIVRYERVAHRGIGAVVTEFERLEIPMQKQVGEHVLTWAKELSDKFPRFYRSLAPLRQKVENTDDSSGVIAAARQLLGAEAFLAEASSEAQEYKSLHSSATAIQGKMWDVFRGRATRQAST